MVVVLTSASAILCLSTVRKLNVLRFQLLTLTVDFDEFFRLTSRTDTALLNETLFQFPTGFYPRFTGYSLRYAEQFYFNVYSALRILASRGDSRPNVRTYRREPTAFIILYILKIINHS